MVEITLKSYFSSLLIILSFGIVTDIRKGPSFFWINIWSPSKTAFNSVFIFPFYADPL